MVGAEWWKNVREMGLRTVDYCYDARSRPYVLAGSYCFQNATIIPMTKYFDRIVIVRYIYN